MEARLEKTESEMEARIERMKDLTEKAEEQQNEIMGNLIFSHGDEIPHTEYIKARVDMQMLDECLDFMQSKLGLK